MDILFYPDKQHVDQAMLDDDPLLMLVSYNGERIIVGNVDDTCEHYILLKAAGFPETDIDSYFRIVVNRSEASWTFVCPSSYLNIPDRERRLTKFYENGIDRITIALKAIEYDVQIDIPRRYRRHLDELRDTGK
jgi:hypothetical protein